MERTPKHGEIMKHAGNTNSKRPGNKNSIEPENPSASPPLSSESALKLGATKIIENSSFPLEVKETLVQRTSKHGDIVIYESKNPYHSKVLMIDEAIWDTSFIGSSTLETKIFNMLECLPKPKKVLVIGRCEGRIMRELIRHGVESIDVYDIGESGPGQAKELRNLYCKYFPKLAIYLRHHKVSYIDGGVDFLKNQQNVFDVIIIRSSWKSLYSYLFTYEYLDSVKSALKEGGIAVFIVSGQNVEETMGSGDFVEHDVQLLCKQLFPMVKYFQFHSFSNIDHPSCLTRVLLCGLNQGKDLEEL